VNFSSVWTTVAWTESLRRIITSFIDIWDSAEHQMSSMIHQVECHSGISQDLNCCRRQMKDGILYEVQVVWMNDDFFWASQCLKHLSKIYQLSLAELSEWVLFSLCEWYSYFHWWIAASTPKSCMKDTTTALRSWPTNWHWQMWVWSQVNQVPRVHSESEKGIQMNPQKMKAIMNWQALNQ
jgi:hypothetical protein